ncbi:Hint domain-containing protein [Chachezhania antarctica]|uniref:Hint domain-containing protein n=1 Tax=Chachezhania antarctica TaxID=2340860 RepID=UPI0013CEA64F|nr:Hint domain-containing protein [Chachezhania antarctica]|tara:strand:- start:1047 stop:2261 length:1215 start_codon:yes stop_codon:yes gene_type:complete
MATDISVTFSYKFFANGNIVGNPGDANNPLRVQPTSQPFNQNFDDNMGGTITAAPNAQVRLTYKSNEIVEEDVNNDGTDEETLPNAARIRLFEVDLDGDGIFESEVRGQNPNDLDLQENNQTGANIAYLNSNLRMYVNGSNTGSPFSSSNLYLSNSAPFGDNGSFQQVPVEYSGENFVVAGDPGYPVFPCFVAGTRISTPSGTRPVETLAIGDLVMTRDNGVQPVRWIGSRTIEPEVMRRRKKLRTIRIEAGALGQNLPRETLRVSAQHRILISTADAELMFGAGEVLVPAVALLGLPGVSREDTAGTVTYFHFLMDRHEIVTANGIEAESLYSGDVALRALEDQLPDAIFDDMETDDSLAARLCLKRWEAETLISRVLQSAGTAGCPVDLAPEPEHDPGKLSA